MSKRQILTDINSQIRNAPGAKAITKEIDAALRDRMIKEAPAKAINRSTALTISTASDAHYDWWGNTINIQSGAAITIDAALPEGYFFMAFATGQNGSVTLPNATVVTISYQKKLPYTFVHLGADVYRVFEEPIFEGGGGGDGQAGGQSAFNSDLSVYNEHNHFIFEFDESAVADTTVLLKKTAGGAGETALVDQGVSLLFINHHATHKLTFDIEAGGTYVKEDKTAFTGKPTLNPGKSCLITSTMTLGELRVQGDIVDVSETSTVLKSLINLQGKNMGPAPFPWSNMASYPSGSQIELIIEATGTTTEGWIMRLPVGTNFQGGGGSGPSGGVGEFIPEVSREYGYLSSAPGSIYVFEFENTVTPFVATDRFKLTLLSSITTSGGRRGLFYAGDLPPATDPAVESAISEHGTLVDSFGDLTPVSGGVDNGRVPHDGRNIPLVFENVAPVNGVITLHFAQYTSTDIVVINGFILEKTA